MSQEDQIQMAFNHLNSLDLDKTPQGAIANSMTQFETLG
jgi:hypothetical protein